MSYTKAAATADTFRLVVSGFPQIREKGEKNSLQWKIREFEKNEKMREFAKNLDKKHNQFSLSEPVIS